MKPLFVLMLVVASLAPVSAQSVSAAAAIEELSDAPVGSARRLDDGVEELVAAARPPASSRPTVAGEPVFVLSTAPVDPADVTVGEPEDDGPWRLQRELRKAGAPDWLKISGSIRARYEGLSGQFRSAGRLDDDDSVIVLRTLLKIEADFDTVAFAVEGEDSRALVGDSGSALGTGTVNAVELLQAYVNIALGELADGTHRIRAGRQTMNLGSRRLVARNRFRNTINAFTGIHWEWASGPRKATAFYTLPVSRLPTSPASLGDNDIQFDDEDFDRQFFGVHYESDVFDRHRYEVYGYGLLEDVGRSRDIGTIGGRFRLPKAKAAFDYETEAAVQFGRSRLSASGSTLDHFAGFVHVSVGYTFDAAWSPRVRLALDYASGDGDPDDGDNGRFETLFGARRFEYGPTGIYGAIGRFNLLSPELRLEVKPASDITVFVAWRVAMLASDRDAWTSARVQDPTGDSGRLIGNQLETRFRWDFVPGVTRLEAGVAWMIEGEFQDEAPNARGGDTVYGYVQLAFRF